MKYRTARRIFTSMFFLCFIFILFSMPMLAAQAKTLTAHPPQAAAPADPFGDLVTTLKSLTGVAAMIAVLVNMGKSAGLVKDGQAGAWSAALNLLVLVGLLVLQTTSNSSLVPAIDTQAGGLASLLPIVLSYILQIFASRQTHSLVLAGLPLIGQSHTGRVAGESISTVIAG